MSANNQSTEGSTSEEKKLTPEEVAANRQRLKDHYEKSIPMLESQLKYETLLTQIEEQRHKQVTMRYQMAMMMAPPPPEEGEEEQGKDQAQDGHGNNQGTGPRKLKKEEPK